MPDRDGDPSARLGEHGKALRLRDVFEIDAAEGRFDQFDRAHDVGRLPRAHAKRHGVDAAEQFEQKRLAFHDRQSSLRTDVSESEHARTVRDDGDRVAAIGVGEHLLWIASDRAAWLGNAGRVPDGEIAEAVDRNFGLRLDLAAIARVHLDRPAGEFVEPIGGLIRFPHRSRPPVSTTRIALLDQSTQRISSSSRATGGGEAAGRPTTIGATGSHASGAPRAFPAGVPK